MQLSCPQIPFYCGLFTADKAGHDDGEKRLHLQNSEGHYIVTIKRVCDIFCKGIDSFYFFHFLPLQCVSVQTLLSSLHSFSSCLDLSFLLLSILTQDWCALLCRCLPLKNWQPTLLDNHILLVLYFQFWGLFLAPEKMTDKLFDFWIALLHVTFEWKPTHDASLWVIWHLKYSKICHYQWTLWMNMGHSSLSSNVTDWNRNAEFGKFIEYDLPLTIY